MAGPRTWRHESLSPGRGPAAVLLVAALAAGCKSGTWGAKPSWWSFGGSPPATSLTAAPEFKQDVTKPSEAAKPYPTTETPAAYSLAGGSQTAASQAAAPAGPTLEPMSVTYGSTPPPAEPQALAQPTSQPAAGGAGLAAQPAGIGPQVGPYASLQPAPPGTTGDPAAAATAGLAAAPAFGEAPPPAAAPRMADARSSDAWAASPPPAGTDPRYGASPGSRFSSGFQPAAIDPAAAPFAPSAAPAFPAPAAPPATSIDPAPAAASPPAAPADALPGSLAPPRRRPDPGYRPGGTSSYRPSRSILADDEAAAGGVMPASFEARTPGP